MSTWRHRLVERLRSVAHLIEGEEQLEGRLADALLVQAGHVLGHDLGQQPQRLEVLQDVARLVRDEQQVQRLRSGDAGTAVTDWSICTCDPPYIISTGSARLEHMP